MPARLNAIFFAFCLMLLFSAQSGAGTAQPPDMAKAGEERQRVRLKQVEQQFVTDNDKRLQQYKKEFGGGKYNLELLGALAGASRTREFTPATPMLKCREQYIIELYTLKREKEHLIFYCMDNGKPVETGFYTKNRKQWKLDRK